ncbi:hypothetical protein JQ604_24500 [Bradyrhizobium jicamae]|uniref:hypothetical protein n=1 Tax=Bradyrhizobium jicamae TaxID=280332 RepID=UPI001BA4E244|nr:hypothetical protein [Bradyrhizobium jicamae]
MEHARTFEPIQDGRIYIEKINAPFLFGDKATAAEYKAGLNCASRVAGSICMRTALMSGSCRRAPLFAHAPS